MAQTPPLFRPPGMNGAPAPRFELPTPFGPNLGEDGLDHTFASNALVAIRAGWEEMRALRPDMYEGLTLHGSLVKGRLHKDSDVDGYAFCNPDASPDVDQQAQTDLRTHIANRLKSGGYGESFWTTDSYRVVDMSPRLLDAALQSVLRGFDRGDSFAHDLLGMDRILPLFYMPVGSGSIPAYRSRVISRLAGSEHGEQVWADMMDTLARKEEFRRRASIDLPRSLGAATVYFE